jgi:outer membrane murein-binding lipoprotein Lpp
MRKLNAIFASMFLCLCLAGCSSTDKNAPPLTEAQNTAKTQLESQMKAAATTAQTYHAMDNPTLLNHLLEQSKAQKEPFNSLAYRELKTRTNVDSNSLVTLVNQNDNAAGLLPLLLLRKLDNKSYLAVPIEVRATILTDALQSSKNFNTWGLPHLYVEDASRAMFEAAPATYPALRRMLSDTRPAPVFGSQEYTEYLRYKYRLCDYALFFLENKPDSPRVAMPISSADRDALIKALPTK